MANCEKCGKSIEEGLAFCDDCSGAVKRKTSATTSTTDILHDDHELFSFKGQHSSNIVRIMKILPYLLGVISIILGLLFLFPDLVDITIPSDLLPVVVTFLGVIYFLRLSRQSQIPFYIFLVLIVITLTMGSALIFTDYIPLIFAIGTTIASFVLIYTVFRDYKKNKIPIFTATLIIVSIGAGVVFPELLLTVLPIALVISGVLIVLKF
ncbi:MAG: hypothetical protein KAT16_03760 [Candidatus Heimdallarchaeota archaeon]|nr:hypothetical protein [Candidatus Heimdallarchaeota archaeon]